MKYLAAVLMVLLLVGSSGAQEVCIDGVKEAKMANGDTLALCFPLHPDPEVLGHEIYMRKDGEAFDFSGKHTVVLNGDCKDGECNAPITISTNGVYYFTTIAFGEKFLRSGPGNEVKLTVRKPLDPGSSCSIIR